MEFIENLPKAIEAYELLTLHYVNHLTVVKTKMGELNLRFPDDQRKWVEHLFESKTKDAALDTIRRRANVFRLAANSYDYQPFVNLAEYLEQIVAVSDALLGDE